MYTLCLVFAKYTVSHWTNSCGILRQSNIETVFEKPHKIYTVVSNAFKENEILFAV
jgi:hypothetical protein